MSCIAIPHIKSFKGLVPTELPCQRLGSDMSHLPKELVKLVNFLKTQPQVQEEKENELFFKFELFQTKCFVRNLEKPVSGVGVKCIAVRSQALTRANVGDIKSSLDRLNVSHISKGNIK